MKKVINITLGGQVFAIEQTAFAALEAYIGAIKSALSVGDDIEEIVSDIETALAEKFVERGRSEKMAVTEADVAAVTSEMGAPTDFGNEGEDATTASATDATDTESKKTKRLYRDTDDAVIAGVASGIAQYFAIDPVIVRIIFVVSLFFNGLGVLAYVILWLAVPAANTTTQKYAMRGDKVTLKEISERVKKSLADDSEEAVAHRRGLWKGFRNVLEKIFAVIGVLVRAVMTLLRYVFGLGFLVGGSVMIAGLFSAYSILLLSERVFLPEYAQTVLEILIASSLGLIALAATFMVILIPLLVIIMIGGSLLAGRSIFSANKNIVLAVVWLTALVVAVTTISLHAEQVVREAGPVHINDRTYEVHMDSNEQGTFIWVEELSQERGTSTEGLPESVVE